MKDLRWTVVLEHVLSSLSVVIETVHPFIIREADTNKACLRPHDQRALNPPPPSPLRTDYHHHHHHHPYSHLYAGSVQLYGGTQWRSRMRHCATSRKVAGSIPDGVIGVFY